MKPKKSDGVFRPFQDLSALLNNRSLQPRSLILDIPRQGQKTEVDIESDHRLFEKAMAGVKPILKDKCRKKIASAGKRYSATERKTEANSIVKLDNLIKNGAGFLVADTAEYVEGVGYHVNPAITKHLHRGDFSIQAHIDLHGLSAHTAEKAFNRFLKEVLLSGKRAVLVVHGRGLSSPDKPVLKNKVFEWLTIGPWRKWVLAFTSARLCDGGAGATYVLLRQRPLTKRFRKSQ